MCPYFGKLEEACSSKCVSVVHFCLGLFIFKKRHGAPVMENWAGWVSNHHFISFGDTYILFSKKKKKKEDLNIIPLVLMRKKEPGWDLPLGPSLVSHSGCNLLGLQQQSNQLAGGRQTSILVQH